MSTQENKRLVRQIVEEWNSVNADVSRMLSLFDRHYAPGFVYHDVSTGDTDREQTIRDMAAYLSAFPDAYHSTEDILAEGDKTAIRCTLRGTHKGAFKGIAPTGRRISIKQFEIQRVVSGKIVEAWGLSDSQGMMVQLGAVFGAAPGR